MAGTRKKFYSNEIITIVDAVTIKGTKIPIAVDQDDGDYPPIALVLSTKVIQRQPTILSRGVTKEVYRIPPPPKGKKYCSACGDWQLFEDFSPDRRNRDGLQSHCKFCHAKHERMMYWLRKEEARMRRELGIAA